MLPNERIYSLHVINLVVVETYHIVLCDVSVTAASSHMCQRPWNGESFFGSPGKALEIN